MACGARHSVARTKDGKVFCWGWDAYGAVTGIDRSDAQMAGASEDKQGCVLEVGSLSGRCVDVAAGGWHTHVLIQRSIAAC